MDINIEIYVGKDAEQWSDLLVQLRLKEFCEFPYLYVGTVPYEQDYASSYTQDQQGIISIAKVGNKIAGICTGIPLNRDAKLCEIFTKHNLNPDLYYYYGEFIIFPEFRGHGIAAKLCAAQDKIIRQWGYEYAAIMTVVRNEQHPLQPKNYRSSNKVWERLGFQRNSITAIYNWFTIDTDHAAKNLDNEMEFWIKKI